MKLQVTIANNNCIMKLLLIDLVVVRQKFYSVSVNDVHLRIITQINSKKCTYTPLQVAWLV